MAFHFKNITYRFLICQKTCSKGQKAKGNFKSEPLGACLHVNNYHISAGLDKLDSSMIFAYFSVLHIVLFVHHFPPSII